MQMVFAAAVATALAVGAGAGAVTQIGPPETPKANLSDVDNPIVGGQAMPRTNSILYNIARSPEHTDFAAALKLAGLSGSLSGRASFTVFAPTNAAFAALGPAARRTASMRYLVVPGFLDSRALLHRINSSDGDVKLRTLDGNTITVSLNGPTNMLLTDGQGDLADISVYDVYSSNGVIHVIDRVLEPAVREQSTVAMATPSPGPD